VKAHKEGKMSEHITHVCNILFPDEGEPVSNIKFFLGRKRGINSSEIAEELSRGISMLENNVTKREKNIKENLTPVKVR